MAKVLKIKTEDEKKYFLQKFRKEIQSANLNFLIGSGCSLPAIQLMGEIENDVQEKREQGKFDEAITYLNDFSSSDLLIQARAYALIGDAYVETKDMANAISYYQKAADYKENEYFTPMYLMKLAQAQEANNDFAGAVTSYNKIVKNYPKAQELNDAKKRLARAEQMQ